MYPYVRLNKIKFTQSFTEKRFVLGYFLAGIWKKILPFSKSTPSTFSVTEVLCKSKQYLSSREKKCFTWVFSDWNSKNPFSYLKSSPSNLSKFGAKIKTLKLGTKNALIRNHCHIEHQRPRICLIAKFGEKIKILKFGTKNALFEYFWVGTWK